MSYGQYIVTGGNGFIGTHLVKALDDGADPHWCDSNVKVIDRPTQLQNCPDDYFKFGDRPADCIFHLAATARVGYSLDHPEEVLDNNFAATLRVLEFCRLHPQTRLIHISSSSVRFADLRENPYALSKKISEDLVTTYAYSFGVRAVNVRLFNVYGPGEVDNGKYTTLIKACKRALLDGRNFRINGDGSIRRDYSHVLDVVAGLLAVERDLVNGMEKPLYELGGTQATSVLQVVEAFQEGTNLEIDWHPPRQGDAPVTHADPNLRPTGWEPLYDVLDYIQDWKAAGCPND